MKSDVRRPQLKEEAKWDGYDVIVNKIRVRDKIAKIKPNYQKENPMPYDYYWVDWDELKFSEKCYQPSDETFTITSRRKIMQTIRYDILKEVITDRAKKFVKTLNGRFSEHVSDAFITAYLVDRFVAIYTEQPSTLPLNIAYNSAVNLFEHLLEHGCGALCNGHHVAQDFSDYFKEGILTEKELRKYKLKQLES